MSTNNKLICTCYVAAIPLVIFQKLSENFGFTLGWDPVIFFSVVSWARARIWLLFINLLFLFFFFFLRTVFARTFRATSAALIRGRRLFEGGAYLDIYFFYILIQQYTFCLLIFLWTDTKMIVNLELRVKFTRWKNTRESHDNESENISGESITGAALIRRRRFFE